MKFKFYISKKYYEMHSAYGNAHLNEKNNWTVLHLPIFVQIYANSAHWIYLQIEYNFSFEAVKRNANSCLSPHHAINKL